MVRVLHFADVHIGMENYGKMNAESGMSSRVHDFVARMDEMVKFALDNGVELAIFAGDAFKNKNPNPTLQREFANCIRPLSEVCPVVMLVGNHDLATNNMRASSIDIYDTLKVHNVFVGNEFMIATVDTAGGPVELALAPYPTRALLFPDVEELAGMGMRDLEDAMTRRLIAKIDGLARRAAESDAPRVLVGHFSIAEAQTGSERTLMLSRDISVPVSEVANPVWDYVALGHIHRHQNLTKNRPGVPPVVYSGSLEAIDFGEEGDRKGFAWIELERGRTTWQFVPVHSRPFVSLDVNVRGSLTPIQDILDDIAKADLTDAVVRLTIPADEDQESMFTNGIEQLRAALYTAGVNHIASIDVKMDRIRRTRLDDGPEGFTNLELVEKYLKSNLDISKEWLDDLLERAQKLLDPDMEEASEA